MSANATQMLNRILSTSRPSSFHALRLPTRLFTTSSAQLAKDPPSISNINPHDAHKFNEKRKQFRESLAASREQADSQSSPSSTPGSALAGAASQVTSGESNGKKILGSLASSNAGDARTAAEGSEQAPDGERKKGGALSSLIYGTEAGRQMDQDLERSFSQMLARGKYVHSIVLHDVKPDKVDEYVELVGDWYPKVANNPDNKVHLVGSWRTEVGDCDTFGTRCSTLVLCYELQETDMMSTVHIWEYQRYEGYHDSLHTIWHRPEFEQFDRKLKTLIRSKKTSLMQEFSFWPTTSPRRLGGLFELRAYTLHPGNLLEWETHWRKGLEARREVMEGVGAWFVQIGELNTGMFLLRGANRDECSD